MPDDDTKSAIPAWQRTAAPKTDSSTQPTTENGTGDRAFEAEETSIGELKEVRVEAAPESLDGENAQERERWDGMDRDRQLEHMRAFLEDAAVQDEPAEKKRAFFLSKGISKDLIDQVLDPTKNDSATFSTTAFDAFQQRDAQSRAGVVNIASQPQHQAAPPIITYPEFLVEAHKPPPLITISRLVNTAYVAGALATLTYAANQYLLKPMVASLTDARRDFATHNQTKLDDLNERLAKIVSKVPESKTNQAVESAGDDAESIDSDPTELFHRDIGTQTSTPPSPTSSSSLEEKSLNHKTVVDKHEERLRAMQSRLSEINAGFEAGKKASETEKEKLEDLRHSLDVMLYGSQAINLWSQNEDVGKKDKISSVTEELQKEIKGVKSSLLSARRFPPPKVYGRGGST